MEDIRRDHECFSTNYKYVQFKDENFKFKTHFNRNKKVFEVEKNSKCVFSLLNKISKSNYESIKNKIFLCLDNVELDVFVEKLLVYSEMSDLYTELISNILYELKTQKNVNIQLNFDLYIQKYFDFLNYENLLTSIQQLDYDDYDQFCLYKKTSLHRINMLRTIISILFKFNFNNTPTLIPDVFDNLLQNINKLCDSDVNNKKIFIFEHMTHIELIIRKFTIYNQQTLLNTCEKVKLLNDYKLKFKIEDIVAMHNKK
jgi:hypothetical protein